MITNEVQLRVYKEKLEYSKEWSEEFKVDINNESLELTISFKDANHKSWEQFIKLSQYNLKLDLGIPDTYKEYTRESFDKLTNMFYRVYRIYVNDNKY